MADRNNSVPSKDTILNSRNKKTLLALGILGATLAISAGVSLGVIFFPTIVAIGAAVGISSVVGLYAAIAGVSFGAASILTLAIGAIGLGIVKLMQKEKPFYKEALEAAGEEVPTEPIDPPVPAQEIVTTALQAAQERVAKAQEAVTSASPGQEIRKKRQLLGRATQEVKQLSRLQKQTKDDAPLSNRAAKRIAALQARSLSLFSPAGTAFSESSSAQTPESSPSSPGAFAS